MRQNARAALAAIALSALAGPPAAAEEGMWTFDNFPAARMQAQLGWAPDRAWLDRAMAATARMPGCSASVVSGEGLTLTNHHCVIGCLTAVSSPGADYVETAFVARAREEEVRCPGLSVDVLDTISDVTAQIDAAASGASDFALARDREIARLTDACRGPGVRCEVETLYQGGRYALYRFRTYSDVRLVLAPERAMAAFGGDADNFSFPRYCLDFAFVRLYENGAPAATPAHLRMRFTPLEDGEIVLAAGNPGRTSRLRTTQELAFERDVVLPWQIALMDDARVRLAAYAARGDEERLTASSALQSVDNAAGGLAGRLHALQNPEALARVAQREADLQARIRRNLAARRETGDPWGEIARAEAAYRGMFHRYQYLELRAGEQSALFTWARDIVRGAAEREKPDGERLSRYQEARLPSIAHSLRAPRRVTASFEEVLLAFWLSQTRAHLGDDAALTQLMFGGEAPEALAARLAQSRLADPGYRMELWEGGAAAVAASDDPMIAFVRAWDGEARAIRARYVADVEGPLARAQERIARARFRAFGEAQYPDATFSPRLSYGRVEGWEEPGGAPVAAFTTVEGLFARAGGAAPFTLSESWRGARARLAPGVIVNVASSTDVIGGNSGSPLLDREGRVVGAVFDGNMHALAGEYYYDGALNRSVTVASTIIAAAVTDVYGMDALAAELAGAN
ncbi:MAG: S46 family peptidase [Hyphomonadaceae bacterium]